jgi:hypothetical protein
VIFVRRLFLATLGAFFTACSAFFAAALRFGAVMLTRTFRAALRAFGATRFGFLLIGLRRALRHRHRECSKDKCEQHYEYCALSGFHFYSPIETITVGHQHTHRHFDVKTLVINPVVGELVLNQKNAVAKISWTTVRNQRNREKRLTQFATAGRKWEVSLSGLI